MKIVYSPIPPSLAFLCVYIICYCFFQEKLLTTMVITDDIEELAIMKHRFEGFEHEMNANASKVGVVNQLARQLLQVEHPNAAEVIQRQNDLNTR